MGITTEVQKAPDIAAFYRNAPGTDHVNKLEKAGNSSTEDLFFSASRQRTDALKNLVEVGRILIVDDGNRLQKGNVVEVRLSERSDHQYKLRVLENAGTASGDKVSWVHVRPNTTVNGHAPNFDSYLLETVMAAKTAAAVLKAS